MASVSIIIPAFNPGGFLRPAMESVCAQTFVDWEAIVVDDGSSEDVSWVADVDPRVRYLRQQNQGQARARNRGMEEAGGKYVAFIDQDDLWFPSKLQRQVELLEANEAMPACHVQFELINAKGQVSGSGYGRHQSYEEMLEGTGICGASTVMVRRGAMAEVGAFHDQDRPAEDLDLWLRLARLGSFGFIDEVLVEYRVHGENQSLNYRPLFSAIKRIQLRQLTVAPEMRDRILTGIANYSRDASGKAFEQLRFALRQRSIFAIASHCAFILTHRPEMLTRAVIGKCFGSPVANCVRSTRSP